MKHIILFILFVNLCFILSNCGSKYMPTIIPLSVSPITKDSNYIAGLKCSFYKMSGNILLGIEMSSSNTYTYLCITNNELETKLDDISFVSNNYYITIEDIDGISNYGDFKTTNIIVQGEYEHFVVMTPK